MIEHQGLHFVLAERGGGLDVPGFELVDLLVFVGELLKQLLFVLLGLEEQSDELLLGEVVVDVSHFLLFPTA